MNDSNKINAELLCDYDIIDTHCVTVVIMLIVYLFLSFLFLSFLPLFLFSLLLCLPFPSFSLSLSLSRSYLIPFSPSLPLSSLFLFLLLPFLLPSLPLPFFLSSCPSLPLRLLIMLKWSTNSLIPLLVPPPPHKNRLEWIICK